MKNHEINIFLGSLSNNYNCKGPFTHPLNLGSLAVYAKKFFKGSEKLNFKLFVYPEKMIDAIRKNPPDIIALGNYTWNDNLNSQVLKLVKKEFPKIITLMGGPNFNTHNMETYFQKRPYLNYFVVNQGETGFLNLIELYSKNILPHKDSKKKPVTIDNLAYYDAGQKKVIMGNINHRYKDLDIIPSAYQEGILDEFFEDPTLIPIIETMRGCPFSCTFCAWGDDWLRASNRFSLERIRGDLDYIAKKMKRGSYLYIADSNFGMHKRDKEIATQIRNISDKTGWPTTMWATWAKNSSESVLEIAEILKPLLHAGLTIAYESFDPTTLKNVKRQNISLDHYNKIRAIVKAKGLETHTDVILGLPGETLESYLNGLRKVFNQRFDQVITFNCRLLGGSEMNTPAYIEKYGIKTKFRMLVQGYGIYAGQTVVEHEEVVIKTNTMTEDEILSMRPINWFIYLFWNYRYYREVMRFALLIKINPVDFFLNMIKNLSNSNDEIGKLFKEFQREAKSEWCNSAEEVYEKYSKKDKSNKLIAEQFAKLNAKYTSKVNFDHKKKMDEKVLEVLSQQISEKYKKDLANKYISTLKEIIDFCARRSINMKEILTTGKSPKKVTQNYSYNFFKWMKNGGEESLNKYNGGVKINFYLSKDRERKIFSSAEEQKYESIHETYMKMLEIIHIDDLFLNVEEADKKDKESKIPPKKIDRAITSWMQNS